MTRSCPAVNWRLCNSLLLLSTAFPYLSLHLVVVCRARVYQNNLIDIISQLTLLCIDTSSNRSTSCNKSSFVMLSQALHGESIKKITCFYSLYTRTVMLWYRESTLNLSLHTVYRKHSLRLSFSVFNGLSPHDLITFTLCRPTLILSHFTLIEIHLIDWILNNVSLFLSFLITIISFLFVVLMKLWCSESFT